MNRQDARDARDAKKKRLGKRRLMDSSLLAIVCYWAFGMESQRRPFLKSAQFDVVRWIDGRQTIAIEDSPRRDEEEHEGKAKARFGLVLRVLPGDSSVRATLARGAPIIRGAGIAHHSNPR